MNLKKLGAFSALILAGTSCAIAWAATPAETITARQNNFKAMGRAFKGMNDELKKPEPDIALIRTAAQTVDGAAGHVAHGFPRGTGAETGVKTTALPAIWERNPEFRAAATRLTTATRALRGAAGRGDLALIRPAAMAVGGSCKGCHDNFKGHD